MLVGALVGKPEPKVIGSAGAVVGGATPITLAGRGCAVKPGGIGGNTIGATGGFGAGRCAQPATTHRSINIIIFLIGQNLFVQIVLRSAATTCSSEPPVRDFPQSQDVFA